MEKTVPKKVHMIFASLSKFMLHSPLAIIVQMSQAVRSINRGARRTADTLCEKTNGFEGRSQLEEVQGDGI